MIHFDPDDQNNVNSYLEVCNTFRIYVEIQDYKTKKWQFFRVHAYDMLYDDAIFMCGELNHASCILNSLIDADQYAVRYKFEEQECQFVAMTYEQWKQNYGFALRPDC